MAYPEWESGTSYPIGSIVAYNNLTYIATGYHDPANFDPPNVEMGTDPFNPIFLTQRGWTIYATLPTGYSPSAYILSTAILTRKLDFNDDYVFGGQFAPGPYGDDQGISKQEYAGSVNNPTTPCPASKCDVNLNDIRGSLYGSNGQFLFDGELINPVLSPSGLYYIDGPLNPDGESNTLYVWWCNQSPSRFRRSIKIYAIIGYDDVTGDPIIDEKTIVPNDDNYNVGFSTGIMNWRAPGNESAQFVSIPAPGSQVVPELLGAFEIDGND